MRRLVLITLLASLTQACCMPSGTVALTEVERSGVKALLVTLDDYAESTSDPRPRRIHDQLVTCLEDGNMTRGVCGGENVLGRTCGAAVCLDSTVPYDIDFLRRSPAACMLALAILYHEGVHLEQDFSDYLFQDHEEDAYRLTHAMQIWLARELAARRLPIHAATFDQDAAFEGLHEARRGMGTEYLSEICPAHQCRDQIQEFIRAQPGQNLAWIEVSPRVYDYQEVADGELEVVVNFDRVLGQLSAPTKTTYFGHHDDGEAPSWNGPTELIAASPSITCAIGWYVAECAGEASQVEIWNRERVGPTSARLAGEHLVLKFLRPPGVTPPQLAFSLAILLLPQP